jgi:hypothetical protein
VAAGKGGFVSVAGDVPSADEFDASINPNCAIALRSATQSITTGGAGTLVSFDTEEFDNSTMFTPTSTSITVQADGVYLITFYVEWQANATGYRTADLAINGTPSSGLMESPATASVTCRMTATNQFLLTSGDVVTFTVLQNSGSTLTITARAAVTRISGS